MFCDVFTPGNMIMCYDLMCVWKLSRDSLAKHTVPKLNTDMPEKTKKNSWSPWSQSHVWNGTRTIWSEREKEWWMVTVVMKEMTNWCEWDQMRVIGLHDQQAGSSSILTNISCINMKILATGSCLSGFSCFHAQTRNVASVSDAVALISCNYNCYFLLCYYSYNCYYYFINQKPILLQ